MVAEVWGWVRALGSPNLQSHPVRHPKKSPSFRRRPELTRVSTSSLFKAKNHMRRLRSNCDTAFAVSLVGSGLRRNDGLGVGASPSSPRHLSESCQFHIGAAEQDAEVPGSVFSPTTHRSNLFIIPNKTPSPRRRSGPTRLTAHAPSQLDRKRSTPRTIFDTEPVEPLVGSGLRRNDGYGVGASPSSPRHLPERC